MHKKYTQMLKGNRVWAGGYALASLRRSTIRNIGIALILAISVSIPTTVFAWTDTGIILAVEDYFEENAYQFSLNTVPDNPNYTHLCEAQELLKTHELIEDAQITTSTIGIVRIENVTPDYEQYYELAMNYRDGIKDVRVIVADSATIEAWSKSLGYVGNFSLKPGQILTTQRVLDVTEEVTGVNLTIGSTVSIDLLRNAYRPPYSEAFDPVLLDRQIMENLTIVGLFDIIRPTAIANSYPYTWRRNWDPFEEPTPVLGLTDSIIMLDEDVGEETVEKLSQNGFYPPVGYIRASAENLIAAGPELAASNLLALKIQIQESDSQIEVLGLDNIERLQNRISTYLASQVLIILAVPVMVMSLMLTIFTSETSISQRKGEISALRAKGVSFNQLIESFIWESLVLSSIGFTLGLGISIVSAPLMGSSTGLLTFDPLVYGTFMSKMVIPSHSIILAAVTSLFLPAAYLFHVSRRIDISEIGQPTVKATSEIPEDVSIRQYVIGLTAVLVILLFMPIIIYPRGPIALFEILVATLLLFSASYLGSRTMRLVTAEVSGKVTLLLGEKRLYLTQSLRRRKGQFIPLLVILTLTLTTTTMMLIQTTSFQDTLLNESNYAIGADIRVEGSQQEFDWIENLTTYHGVEGVTPVVESLSYLEDDVFFLEALDAEIYRDIGNFIPSSFVGVSSDVILSTLASTPNGIIISEYYRTLWNVSIGDSLNILCNSVDDEVTISFVIVGFMRSAPGFGIASTKDLSGTPYGEYFDIQPGRGGFALTNLDYFVNATGFTTSPLFLAGVSSFDDASQFVDFLEQNPWRIYKRGSVEFRSDSVTGIFLAGLEGLTMICFITCAAMGIASTVLFLGSAVIEREPEYALFRAIGGTKRQIVSLVFGEFAGSVFATLLISFGLGVLFGYTATILTLGISSIWPILGNVVTFPLLVMTLTLSLEGLAMILTCYYPAHKAGNTDPADVLRNM